MAAKGRSELKVRFRNGLKPNETDFGNLIDSFINRLDDGLTVKNKKVGINTGDPQASLHIQSSNKVNESLLMIGDPKGKNLTINSDKIETLTNNKKSALKMGAALFNADQIIEKRMAITESGFIGIGTDAPMARLHVASNVDAKVNAQSAMVMIGEKNGKSLILDDNEIMAKSDDGKSSGPIHIQAEGGDLHINSKNPAKSFVYKDDGRLGIGTNDPKASLHINQPVKEINEDSSSGQLILGETEGEHIIMDNYGIVAKSAPNAVGTLYLNHVGESGQIKYQGQMHNMSDKTLKKEIKPLSKGLKEVLKLNPVSYQWKNAASNNKGEQYGFIAQEVAKHLKNIVQKDSRSGLLSMDSNALIPVLTNAIKEQQNQIDGLLKRMDQLEKMISEK